MCGFNLPQTLRRAVEHHQAGRFAEAEALYHQILAQRPDQPDTLNLLGVLASQLNRHDVAVQLISRATALKPTLAEAHSNLGFALSRLKRTDEAIASYQRALKLQPNYAEVHFNLGTALRELGRLDEAIEHFRRAVALQPNYPAALNNLGSALGEAGRLDQARECFDRALTLAPQSGQAHYNLANVLRDLGKLEEASASFERAIVLERDHAEAHFNHALVLLLQGDFQRGWKEFEWRWKLKQFAGARREFACARPQWNGEDLRGRTILLHAEQGFGDTIQMIRYAPLVAQRGARVIVECQAELIGVIETVAGIDQIIASGDPLPEFDVHCPMMSLPLAMKTTVETIPAEVPYVRAPQRKAPAAPLADGGAMKVGIAWAGRATHPNDLNRSIALELFAPLVSVKGVTFFSLQKNDAAQQLRRTQSAAPRLGGEGFASVVELTDELRDFADTAGLMERLDLVITVDTAVAHLAGAMGKRAWVLLPFVPDWRWLLRRDDSPWYPTMQLFRQGQIGDWRSLIDEVTLALSSCATR